MADHHMEDLGDHASNVPYQQDKANNPGKSNREIKAARELWAGGNVEIRNNNNESTKAASSRYVSRKLVCSLSGRFRELLPTKRSWPILLWDDIIGEMWRFDFWAVIDDFLAFLFNGDTERFHNKLNGGNSGKGGGVLYWCMGAALICPKLQNAAMIGMMKDDLYFEEVFSEHHDAEMCREGNYQDGVLCDAGRYFIANRDLDIYGMINAPHDTERTFRNHKLMSYLVDLVIWEAKAGGSLWLHHVHRGGCLASMIAQGMVDAAQEPAFKFEPWHAINRGLYLVDE